MKSTHKDKEMRWGFVLGVTQILAFALGVYANFSVFRYQHVGIPKAKFSFGV